MNRVFVSGGAGVIGMELIPKLCALGVTVLVADLKPRPAAFPSAVLYRQGDLNSMSQLEFDAFAPELFIHLAATFERSTETYEFWHENFRHNVQLSHHLMTLAKDCPAITRVVFASSYLIYQPALYQFPSAREAAVSLLETDPVSPRNLTGTAKLSHEIELGFLEQFRSAQFSSVCARIFRGYGRGSRDVISRWVRSLLDGDPVKVYRPEGLFDYVYAADSAEGLLRLAQSDCTGIVNLGTGHARRVSEVVDLLSQHFPGMEVDYCESDIPFEASQADTSLLEDATGWKPEFEIETAIPLIIEYERDKRTSPDIITTAKPPKVLLTSASRKVPLIRALQQAARAIHPAGSVVAGDMEPSSLSFHVADECWSMPRLGGNVVDILLERCCVLGITAILPSRDGELMFWARNSERFRQSGIEVMVSDRASLQRCLDKLAFSEFGTSQSLPIIPSSLSVKDLHGERFVVKERFGAGSRAIGIDLDRTQAIDYATNLEAPIYQPYVSGREISIDAWLNRSGSVKGLVLRWRDLVVKGESQITTTFRSANYEAQAAAVLSALKLTGHVMLQAIIDGEGTLNIIECNARFGGASTASIAVGLDSLRWSLLEAAGARIDDYPFMRTDTEVRQVRLPADTYLYGSDI
ncbi:MAG: NAD-dependent epimerase/dehydratase family protein [Cyanobacteria bacterium K_DeepCast_35m_m2_023]|nr:NAD-dependent epimerase/dehydratase family protein [Cyanobacteria bacterium K_DeepCast_35m_m2_023]